jgi:uncharacterized protein (UPF0276 family)
VIRVPSLGVGIVYTPGVEPALADGTDLAQIVEVEPETLWLPAGDGRAGHRIEPTLEENVRRLPQTKLIHGVGFPVGGTKPVEEVDVDDLETMVQSFAAPWASEHLSFNHVGAHDSSFRTGFLLPPRQTIAGVAAATATIERFAARLSVPFAVETGVNYLAPRDDELPDGEFVAHVAEGANCGILLDLHNIWANERNGRQSVSDYVAALPAERVWEIHLAGGSEHRGFWLDSHAGAVPADLLAIARDIIGTLPNVGAIVFEATALDTAALGSDGIRRQLEALNELWLLRGAAAYDAQIRKRTIALSFSTRSVDPVEWEETLGSLVLGRPVHTPLGNALEEDAGVGLLRELVAEFRTGMALNALRLSSRLLMLTLGPDGYRDLLARFWKTEAPQLMTAAEGLRVADFLLCEAAHIPFLADLLHFERDVILVMASNRTRIAHFTYDPVPVIRALARAERPDPALVRRGSYEIELLADGGEASGIAIADDLTARSLKQVALPEAS